MGAVRGIQTLLINSVDVFFQVIYLIILIRIILSWVSTGRNGVTGIIYTLTEPILGPIRSMLDKSPIGGGMLDFSPIIALFVMDIIKMVIKGLIGII